MYNCCAGSKSNNNDDNTGAVYIAEEVIGSLVLIIILIRIVIVVVCCTVAVEKDTIKVWNMHLTMYTGVASGTTLLQRLQRMQNCAVRLCCDPLEFHTKFFHFKATQWWNSLPSSVTDCISRPFHEYVGALTWYCMLFVLLFCFVTIVVVSYVYVIFVLSYWCVSFVCMLRVCDGPPARKNSCSRLFGG